jgi:hypothetical protein
MFLTAFRYVWALPTTCVGLVMVLPTLLSGGRMQFVSGVLELHGGFTSWCLRKLVRIPGGASAMTLGHVVLGRDPAALDRTRDHERVHVRQVERWGPLFLPAYLGCSLWLWLRKKNPYLDNPFEKEAYGTEFGLDG